MKRNEKMVPGFDDIIFRNRNMEYGAYDLRRRYKSTASFSILGVSAFFVLLIILISSLMPKEAGAVDNTNIYVLVKPANLTDPNKMIEPVVKRPPRAPEQPRYVPPKVVDDSLKTTNPMMSTDLALDSIRNGNVTDNIDSVMTVIAPDPDKPEDVFISVEEMPEFPDGEKALLKYIADNTKYPQEAAENNIQGKVVVKFAVSSDGSVKRIEIIRGVNPLLDQEAMRVVSTLPLWKPGKQNGKPVSVWFIVPVNFQIK